MLDTLNVIVKSDVTCKVTEVLVLVNGIKIIIIISLYCVHLDVDECLEGISGCNQICVNKHCAESQYTCSCYDGYYLSNDHICIGELVCCSIMINTI